MLSSGVEIDRHAIHKNPLAHISERPKHDRGRWQQESAVSREHKRTRGVFEHRACMRCESNARYRKKLNLCFLSKQHLCSCILCFEDTYFYQSAYICVSAYLCTCTHYCASTYITFSVPAHEFVLKKILFFTKTSFSA